MKMLNEFTKYKAYKYLRFAFYIAIAGIIFACMSVGDVLLNVFCIITGFDKRYIRKQVSAMGISLEQFENNMRKGCVYHD